jgi:acyl-CoA reductase-like NAD-dependent aldehyde dehydrogenase
VNLELGNATPVVVEADADIEEAATKLAANAFSFAGQSCISVQRIYVKREAYDDFVSRFVPKVQALKVGDPGEEDTDVGPVIDEDARDRIVSWVEEAKSAGATVLAGGEVVGGLLQPTVLADVTQEMKVSCQEVFGPLCTVSPYDSSEEAFELANATEYGLQAGIFTANLKTALAAAAALEFGGVTVNEAPTFRADQMPYGGVKESGNTKEGPHYAVREMTEERLVVLAL